MLTQTISSITIQNLFLKNTITALFGRHNPLSLQILQIILAFLFASPFKPKNSFILKQGTLLLELRPKTQNLLYNSFLLSNSEQQIITAKSKVTIKQGDQLILGNKHYLSQKIKISKIWVKPQTKTQRKILSYCPKFKEFMLGKHHQTKMIDQRYLNREFLVPHYEKDIFDKYLKDVQQNDANYCSNEVLDSYMALITINYIEVELESSEFNDRSQKRYKIVPQGANSEIFTGICLVYDSNWKKWDLVGENLVIWKEEKVFSRKKTLVRSSDGRMELIEGNNIKTVDAFSLHSDESE